MGAELARNAKRTAEQIKGSTDTRAEGNEKRSNADPRPAGDPAGSTASGRPAAPPRRTGAEAEKEKGLSGLASLSESVPVPAEPQKKKKRAPRKKKQEQTAASAEQISAFLLATSQIVGSREGMEVFKLQPEETMQLATPIANMIEKSEKLQNLGEHADAISLVTASLIIFAPRVMIYTEQQKQKKIKKAGGVKLVDQRKGKKPEKTEGRGSVGKPDEPRPAHAENNAPSIYDAIPSTL